MTEYFVTSLLSLSDLNLKKLAIELGLETSGNTNNEIIKSIALVLFERI